MHLLIVQPPYSPNPFAPATEISTHPKQTPPDWLDLCLLAHIHKRSRHTAQLADGRITPNLHQHIDATIENTHTPLLIALHAELAAVRPIATLLEKIHRKHPKQKTAIFGPLPTLFPTHCSNLPTQPYCLQGDPENPLRILLDFFNNQKRLERTQGITWASRPHTQPCWLNTLPPSLAPQWKDINWSTLSQTPKQSYYETTARITRGHTHLPPDYAYPHAHEPFRQHNLAHVAESLQRCSSESITHFFMTDPPGIWSPERLADWCSALKKQANTIPWGLQFLPTLLGKNEIEELHLSACRRIEFIIPSTDPQQLEQYGCVISWKNLRHTLTQLHEKKIQVTFRYWLGGPHADPQTEADQVIKTIDALQTPSYDLHPFPVHLDSPLFLDLAKNDIIDPPETWINYLLHPSTPNTPPIWNMEEGLHNTSQTALTIRKAVKQNPKRIIKKAFANLNRFNWIEELERKAMGKHPMSDPS